MLGQWAVDDCGRVINPLLVDEQVRGGIAQGIGAVLFEECIYSDDANLLNGTMADYLVPMAAEMPDILLDHVETPEASTRLGSQRHRRRRSYRGHGICVGCCKRCLEAARRQGTPSALYTGAHPRCVSGWSPPAWITSRPTG
jgi:hypothetical protein